MVEIGSLPLALTFRKLLLILKAIMKSHLLATTIFIISIVSCKNETAVVVENESASIESIQSKFQATIDSMFETVPNTKGIIMNVNAPDLNLQWEGAIGWADSASQRKLKPTDPALIASMTKTYVSAAILRLVEKGALHLKQPISELLSEQRVAQMQAVGYNVNTITVAHLLSHTSGVFDFVGTELYLNRTTEEPNYEWTKDEQIELALTKEPNFEPGVKFSYSDTNYLLLADILEALTDLPFYTAIRTLLQYEKHGIKHTWFNWLEEAPEDLAPLAHQFASDFKVESYTEHPSFDLYGGGGIAATANDVSLFTQLLFNGELFENPDTKDLLFETIETADSLDNGYFMGIAKMQLGKFTAYGHGGFWGTTMQFFPELNASVSIFLIERVERPKYKEILEKVALLLEQEKLKS